MNHRAIAALSLAAVIAFPVLASAQSSETDELKKSVQTLNETQGAILKELQEIRKLLAQGQVRAGDSLPAQPIDIGSEPSKGNPKAKIAIIEFSDYQCPFCGKYDKDTYPQIVKEYVDSGKLRYVFRDMPLGFHQHAFKAAQAASCAAEQGRFWEMHDRLFANQQTLAAADLVKHAAALELNTPLFQQCLDSGRYDSEIRKDIADAGSIGVSGTPTFLIGVVQPNSKVKVMKKLVGAKSYDDFKTAIEGVLTATP